MTLVSNTIPNLVGGISQQPSALRLTTSCESMINAWPSIVNGLQKRPPTRHIANVGATLSNGVCGYMIERNTSYRYLALITNGDIKVLDLNTGAYQTVSTPDGKVYLQAASPVDAFKFVTFGDFTFIANRKVSVESVADPEKLATYTPDVTVASQLNLPVPGPTYLDKIYYVSATTRYYKVIVSTTPTPVLEWVFEYQTWPEEMSSDGVSLPTSLTGYKEGDSFALEDIEDSGDGTRTIIKVYILKETGTTGTTTYSWQEQPIYAGVGRLDPTKMGTIYVTTAAYNSYYSVYVNGVLKASYLTPTGTSGSAAISDTSQIATEVNTRLIASGYTTIRNGSTITITNLPAGATLQTQGGNGDKMMRCFISDVQSFSDLPPTSPEGRIVRVAGDLEALGDDYYVVFEKGIWRETYDWNQGEKLDVATMPHVLIRNEDGSWTFKKHVWKGRSVGDTESSQNPSFVGKTINDIFVYTNRFGILSDENIILSEADNYENFYRTTTAQLLDSDMIDLAVLHSNVDILHHAIPYNRDLLLMSATNQFRFSYQQFIGQKTANIQYSTSFNVSTRVRPLNVGNSVYFIDDRSDYAFTKAFEYFPKENVVADDAEDITSQVPELIKNNIVFTASSNRAKAIAVYSANSPATLYLYKFFWSGDRKVQSAWTEWTFADCEKIYWADFSGTFLYLLIKRPNGVTLERMRLDEDVFDTDLNYELMLDRRIDLTAGQMTYSALTDRTTITLPYSTTVLPEVVSTKAVDSVFGNRNTVTRVSNTVFTVRGDIRTYTNTVGIPYTKSFEFSTLFFKQAKGSGEVVILDGRTQVRYLTLEYHNTAYFQAQVITPGRDTATSTFVGFVVGSDEAEIGRQAFSSGKYRLPVMAENYKVRILLTNDSPFPSAFGSAEWQAIIALKANKRL